MIDVSDGDTITVLDSAQVQYKIRLMAIDAPEKAQPFGNRSKQNMSDLVFGKPVSVEWTKRDRYGRIVGRVYVENAGLCIQQGWGCPLIDAGLAQIVVGLAWHYKQYENEQTREDRERYAFAEMEATAKKTGLWKEQKPIPPWAWRKANRGKQ